MKRGSLWFVGAADLVSAALFVWQATANFARHSDTPSDVPAVYAAFSLWLGLVIPVLAIAAAFLVTKILLRRRAPEKGTSDLHRLVFWTIFLKAAVNLLLAFFIPSDRHFALASLVNGVVDLFFGGLAFISYCILQHCSWTGRNAK